jgi:hypothetical protein
MSARLGLLRRTRPVIQEEAIQEDAIQEEE